MKLFVYGSLKNRKILKGELLGAARTVEMYHRGQTSFFPFVVHPENKNSTINSDKEFIQGSVYDIKDDSIKIIDDYEGHPLFFKREIIKVLLNDEIIEVYCYLYLNEG